MKKDVKHRRRERHTSNMQNEQERELPQSLVGAFKEKRMKMHVSLPFCILYACICAFRACGVVLKKKKKTKKKQKTTLSTHCEADFARLLSL
jgi:hypothetical protein